jgi:hypothetical protein
MLNYIINTKNKLYSLNFSFKGKLSIKEVPKINNLNYIKILKKKKNNHWYKIYKIINLKNP